MPSIVISRNRASVQNLVDSTKLERIIIDSKSSLRKEKKDKKERRKHKKEKREKKSHKHSSKKGDDVNKKLLSPSDRSPGGSEKSGVTEELDGPQNQLGYLSDGSQNSRKRKRDASPPAVDSVIKAAPVAGKPLRIRLILKNPKVESTPLPQEDVVACSTSCADKAPQAVVCSRVCVPELNVPSTSLAAAHETELCRPELNVPSTSGAAIAETKKRRKHKPSKEERYNALFDDWSPLSSIAMEVDSSTINDDDWLFGSRTQGKINSREAVKIDEDVNTSLHASSDSSWPKAQYLSQVGIYSLPYTVPF